MALSTYFQQTDLVLEQGLLSDLVEESIQIHGIDISYMPRTLVNVDNLLSEDASSQFKKAFSIEMYVESAEGFEGEGDTISQFGLEIRDQLRLSVSRRRWEELQIIDRDRPFEGDLVYFPLNDKLFEIRFVEHEKIFYQLGNLPIYELTCELFEYSHEDIDTGIAVIDDIEKEFGYAIDLVLGTGTGNYTVDETITNGTATAKVLSWNYGTKTLRVGNVVGAFITTSNVIGGTSEASWSLTASPDLQAIPTDTQASNVEFELEADQILDFSDKNPWGEI